MKTTGTAAPTPTSSLANDKTDAPIIMSDYENYIKDSSDPSRIKNWDAPPMEGGSTWTEEAKREYDRKMEAENAYGYSDEYPGVPDIRR